MLVTNVIRGFNLAFASSLSRSERILSTDELPLAVEEDDALITLDGLPDPDLLEGNCRTLAPDLLKFESLAAGGDDNDPLRDPIFEPELDGGDGLLIIGSAIVVPYRLACCLAFLSK
jgi:hypothetical protein